MRKSVTTRAVIGLSLLGAAVAIPGTAAAQNKIKRGEYLVSIMDCAGCHTTGVLLGKPDPDRFLAGSEVGFQIPDLGIFFPPNLTPDRKTGLGTWSERDIIKAVRTGERPDGRMLAPVMPYHSYSKLSDADAQALASYLKSLKPIQHQVPTIIGPSERPNAPYLTVKMPD
jgi:mono/diheme cytochrome c family protein